jgi:hypothetical protein
VLPNGQTAPNGFAALSAFVSNGKDVIDASDPIFNQLEVWVDTGTGGANGTTPVGTLFTLSQLNIQSLNLNATAVDQSNNGNTIGLISSFTTTDGKTHEMADVWLTSAAAPSPANSINQLTSALSQYASTGASTNPSGATALGVTGAGASGGAGTSSAVGASSASVLASALSQYNANGQLVASTVPSTQVASSVSSTPTSQLLGQASTTQVTVTKNGNSSS